MTNKALGFNLYTYNSENQCIADYVQDTEEAAKESAFEEYGVPIDAWNKNIIVVCCFCGDQLDYANAIQLSVIVDNDSNQTQTIFAHKQCLADNLHESIAILFK